MARILCIDGDKVFLHAVAHVLEATGHKVLLSNSGKQGLELADSQRPDIILLATRPKQMSGFKVLSGIREKIGDDPLVVLLIDSGEKKELIEGFRLGADNCIGKPVDLDILSMKVEALLKRGGTEKSPGPKQTPKQMEAVLRSIKQGEVTAASGHLHFVSLADIKKYLGEKWELLADKALAISEAVIKSQLSPGQTYVRHGRSSFFLLLPDMNVEDGRIKSDQIADAIANRLLGKNAEQFRHLKLAVSVGDASSIIKKMKDDDFASFAEAFVHSVSEPPPKEIGLQFIENVGVTFFPVWNSQQEKIVAQHCCPVRQTDYGAFMYDDVLHGRDRDPLCVDLDRHVIGKALKLVKESGGRIPPVVVPIRLNSLMGESRTQIAAAFERSAMTHFPSLHLIIELVGDPESFGQKNILEAVAFVKNYTPLISVRCARESRLFEIFKRAGATFVGFPLRGGPDDMVQLQLKHFSAQAVEIGLRPFVFDLSTTSAARMAMACGFRLLAGKAIADQQAHLCQSFVLPRSEVVG